MSIERILESLVQVPEFIGSSKEQLSKFQHEEKSPL